MPNSKVLTQAVEKLAGATDLSGVTQVVAEAARVLAGAEGATFVLKDDQQCFYVDEHAISPLWKGKRFPLETCVSGWSMLNKQVVLIRDIYQDDRVPKDAYRPTFVKSLCMVPIRAEDPIGAIGSYWSAEHEPTEEEIKLLQILANSSSTAIENLELKRKLSERNLERDDFSRRHQEFEFQLNSLAHDLKNPLATMMGFAEMLQMRSEKLEDPKFNHYASAILNVGDRLNRQIDKILTLYRLTNQTLDIQQVNLAVYAEDIVRGLRAQAPSRKLEVSIAPDLATYADPDLIRLTLENLIGNAFKYSKKKDETYIRIDKVRGAPASPMTEFYVEDHGDGFDPSQCEKLFKPLTRLHSQAEFEGTGLGLASVARIIELHGGSVRAEGETKKGARFYFKLPNSAQVLTAN